MPPSEAITIDVFADIACPWCFIGHRRLRQVIAERPEDAIPVKVRHRAFQLDPTLPPEGLEAIDYFAQRFGSNPERMHQMHERVREAAEDTGIKFRFDDRAVMANTHQIHRAIALAAERDAEQIAVDAMYEATFIEGAELTAASRIVARLDRAGVPDTSTLLGELLAGGGLDSVEADLQLARDLEIRGVPLLIADQRFGLSGAQGADVLRGFIKHAEDARVDG
jgi:predicted DsbA family dithiol-disulfide isomerase